MKNCMECDYKFAFSDRLKMTFNLRGSLTCPKCKSVYRDNFNFYRGIYYGLVTFVSMIIFSEVTLSNSTLKSILYMIIVLPILLLFDLMPHRLHKYIKTK
ncbi:hypothetical protein EAI30_05580 [Romboutsia ilealis]|uniref:Cxxc_20_cxxc protein n=1 Tax=Romboutsia faecis TaxID=2764597 RepID=A0ABR7JNP3_9FIRM|nr:hypothetical protein [Romboutsia faecis]MBC5996556.1 hypothetical protein [Romboutsia faecis]MRN24082.1 hypothetical protein [Romboutsia ilealis]